MFICFLIKTIIISIVYLIFIGWTIVLTDNNVTYFITGPVMVFFVGRIFFLSNSICSNLSEIIRKNIQLPYKIFNNNNNRYLKDKRDIFGVLKNLLVTLFMWTLE